MRVAFYSNAFDTEPRTEDLTWAELVERLSTFRESPRCATWPCTDARCPGKNGPAWSPVEIAGKRANENVRAITVAVFDLDHLDPNGNAIDKLLSSPYALALHSTHKFDAECNVSLRLALPLSRPVKPQEWPHVREAAIRELEIPADPATKDLSRIYFMPNSVIGAGDFKHSQPGKPLDVDEILRIRPTLATPQPLPTPVADPETTPIDLNDLGSRIRRHAKPENRALVGEALRGGGLGPQGTGYLGGQDARLQALMSTVAFCVPDETPWEAIEHLFKPCFASTDWREGTEHLIGQAKDKFDRARDRKRVRDAKRVAENEAIREGLGIARAPSTEATPLDEGETEDPDRWFEKLVGEEGKLANCEANVSLVLRNAVEWREALRFNAVSKQLEIRGAPVAAQGPDALDVHVAVWFQRSGWKKLGLAPKPRMVIDVLRTLPELVSYDPLADYLEGLRWDGVKRVDSFVERYFGALSGVEGDPVAYLRAVSRRWLISLVARGLKPGCKVDTVLCLEGSQGLGKSTALKILASPWFCDSKIDVGSKDTWALAAQFWLIELAETEGMTRATADALKGFFSKSEDTYRPPYGRTNTTTLRRCVLAATTNAQRYLRFDPTGYRRYWPVTCSKVDLDALRADRDQLLAEAVAAFKAGEQWWMTREEADLAEGAARKREDIVGESSQEMISSWILGLAPDKRPRLVKVGQLLTNPDVFGLQRHQINNAREQEIVAALRALGFERYNSSVGRAWRTPATLLEAAQVTPLRGAPGHEGEELAVQGV